jgi:hypothetical protein
MVSVIRQGGRLDGPGDPGADVGGRAVYQASLYQASLILPHCLWLSLLPTTPNKHFVAQKEGQSRELGML